MPAFQQPIMSMEEDDVSDQEIVSYSQIYLWIMLSKIFEYLFYWGFYWFIKGQLEDHGPFQSLSRLWGHHAHLAVFINYVLSNSDPSSLVCIIVFELIIHYIYLN